MRAGQVPAALIPPRVVPHVPEEPVQARQRDPEGMVHVRPRPVSRRPRPHQHFITEVGQLPATPGWQHGSCRQGRLASFPAGKAGQALLKPPESRENRAWISVDELILSSPHDPAGKLRHRHLDHVKFGLCRLGRLRSTVISPASSPVEVLRFYCNPEISLRSPCEDFPSEVGGVLAGKAHDVGVLGFDARPAGGEPGGSSPLAR